MEAGGFCRPEVVQEDHMLLSAREIEENRTFRFHCASHLDPGVRDVGKKGRPVHKRIGRKLRHHSTGTSAGSTTAPCSGRDTLTSDMPL